MEPSTYTRKKFGEDLARCLRLSDDVISIAKWAFGKSLEARRMEAGLREEILNVAIMEAGPEFELSREELKDIAERLRNS